MLINLELVRERGTHNDEPETPSFNNRLQLNSRCIYCEKHQQNSRQLLQTVEKLLQWKNAANLLIQRREEEIKKTMELLRQSELRNNELLKIVDGRIAENEILKEELEKMRRTGSNRVSINLKSREVELMRKIEKLQSDLKSKELNRQTTKEEVRHHRRAISYTQPSEIAGLIPVTHHFEGRPPSSSGIQNPQRQAGRSQIAQKCLDSLKQEKISLKF